MSSEHERRAVPLRAIHVDLKARSILFLAEDFSATRLTLTPSGVMHELLRDESSPSIVSPITERAVERLVSSPEQREQPVTVSGRLKSQPKPGRADAKGNPTAWARLAAHAEGRDDAKLYSATFHRHTARIALTLAKDAQVTVQGYAHASDDPKRMDTLSVVNLLAYPGKPEKGDG